MLHPIADFEGVSLPRLLYGTAWKEDETQRLTELAARVRGSRQLKLFVKLLEPFMLLFMAAIVLVVVMGLLLPVFKMGSAVG